MMQWRVWSFPEKLAPCKSLLLEMSWELTPIRQFEEQFRMSGFRSRQEEQVGDRMRGWTGVTKQECLWSYGSGVFTASLCNSTEVHLNCLSFWNYTHKPGIGQEPHCPGWLCCLKWGGGTSQMNEAQNLKSEGKPGSYTSLATIT